MTNKTQRIALITGGSRGLGRSMAEHLADRGTDLIITYRNDQAAADEVVRQAKASGVRAAALKLDVGQISGFEAFAAALRDTLKSDFGGSRIDYLVNNAGIGVHAPLLETTEAQFDQLLNVHFKGPLFLTQTLVPLLNDGGRILNVSTGLTRIIFEGYGAYAAMKGAVETMSLYMAKELSERNIAVNVIAPGAVETDFGGGVVRDNPQVNEMIASTTALGRVGLPEDIGAAVAMLLSSEASWVNAQRVEVSGGQQISG